MQYTIGLCYKIHSISLYILQDCELVLLNRVRDKVMIDKDWLRPNHCVLIYLVLESLMILVLFLANFVATTWTNLEHKFIWIFSKIWYVVMIQTVRIIYFRSWSYLFLWVNRLHTAYFKLYKVYMQMPMRDARSPMSRLTRWAQSSGPGLLVAICYTQNKQSEVLSLFLCR